jgi:hypothetical protein
MVCYFMDVSRQILGDHDVGKVGLAIKGSDWFNSHNLVHDILVAKVIQLVKRDGLVEPGVSLLGADKNVDATLFKQLHA